MILKYINSIRLVPATQYNPAGSIEIVRTHYQKDELCWALRGLGSCYNKEVKSFCLEARPSERDDEFYKEFRFNTPSEALEAFKDWLEFHSDRHQLSKYYKEHFDYKELTVVIKKMESIK